MAKEKKDSCLPKGYKYQPLPDYLMLEKSNIHGLGVHAVGEILEGHIFPISHRTINTCEVIRQDYGGWINHSAEPNCELIPVMVVPAVDGFKVVKCALSLTNLFAPVALKDIVDGEEITLNYHNSICGL